LSEPEFTIEGSHDGTGICPADFLLSVLLDRSVSRMRRATLIQGNIVVVIRLARGGAKKRPFFNIVVADARVRRDGRFIERVGFYNPVASGAEQPLRVAFDRVEFWKGNGAQLSPTVARLVEQAKATAV
jgi:small subunit ribosomal protein S16